MKEKPNIFETFEIFEVRIKSGRILKFKVRICSNQIFLILEKFGSDRIFNVSNFLDNLVRSVVYWKGTLHCQCIFSIFPAGTHQLKCKHTCIEKCRLVFLLTINLHCTIVQFRGKDMCISLTFFSFMLPIGKMAKRSNLPFS